MWGQREGCGGECWRFPGTYVGASVSGGNSVTWNIARTVRIGKAAKGSDSSRTAVGATEPGKLAELLAECKEIQKWVSEKGNDKLQLQP